MWDALGGGGGGKYIFTCPLSIPWLIFKTREFKMAAVPVKWAMESIGGLYSPNVMNIT